MSHTESDAKTKWCPLVRFSDEGADVYSMSSRGEVHQRDDEPRELTRCIASACMAWRWDRSMPSPVGGYVGESENGTHGFCGAFGAQP